MRCCVPNCGNVKKVKKSGNNPVTFHLFPNVPEEHTAWVNSLDIADWTPSERTVICSDHFNEDDFYSTKDGSRRVKPRAVPVMNVCRICLDHNAKLYNIKEFSQRFEEFTGISASGGIAARLPQHLCWECAARLSAAAAFRQRALRCDRLLRGLMNKNTVLRLRDIKKSINREHCALNTSLVKTHLDNRHYHVLIRDTSENKDKLHDKIPKIIKEEQEQINDVDDDVTDSEDNSIINNENIEGNNVEHNDTVTTQHISNEIAEVSTVDMKHDVKIESVDSNDSSSEMDQDVNEESIDILSSDTEVSKTSDKLNIDVQDEILPVRSKKNRTKEKVNIKIMERISHPSSAQVEALLQYLQEKPLLAKRFLRNPTAKLNCAKEWDIITTKLNSIPGGAVKNMKKWMKYWSDKKCAVKKKATAQIQALKDGSSIDDVPQFFLSDIEERILTLIGFKADGEHPKLQARCKFKLDS